MLQTLASRPADPAGAPPPATGAYKVDISRGERIGRVSSEWFSSPDDERYLSLSALHTAVRSRSDRATARTVETKTLRVEASRDDAEHLALIVPGRDEPIAPTHWSYGQLCGLIGAPASYALHTLADSTIYEMEQRGEFPLRFALSPRCIVWDLAEVQAWLLARRAKPIHRAQHPDVTKRKFRPVKGRDRAEQEA